MGNNSLHTESPGIPVQTASNLKQLVTLALPVIATSFTSIAYNVINIIFVGKLGSHAVAAVGSAGFYMHLSWGLSTLLTAGVGIKVSHAVGSRQPELSKQYVRSGLQAISLVSLLYVVFVVLARKGLIGLIGLNDPVIEQSAANYLCLIALSIPFSHQNLLFTNALIGYGDSKTPFKINTIAFVLNAVLDPLLIFGAGMGIYGTSVGTIVSQALATALFYQRINSIPALRPSGNSFDWNVVKKLLALGVSPTLQRVSFTFIAIAMARIISDWGPTAIAVQKVGIQIEAVTFMTAGGFMSALASLSGKAYGAGDYSRQWKTFLSGMSLATAVGLLTSALMIAFPETLFSIFLNDVESLEMGHNYLLILGYSQLFMCLELMATGAFFGWGKTHIPAIMGIVLTLLRIPLALLFIHVWDNSLSSVWWSISISSMAKGTLLVVLFVVLFRAFLKKQTRLPL